MRVPVRSVLGRFSLQHQLREMRTRIAVRSALRTGFGLRRQDQKMQLARRARRRGMQSSRWLTFYNNSRRQYRQHCTRVLADISKRSHIWFQQQSGVLILSLFFVFSEIIGFNCPEKPDPHSVSAKFEPYPRYALPGDQHRLITCVNGHPRLISCGEDSVVDESSLTCVEYV